MVQQAPTPPRNLQLGQEYYFQGIVTGGMLRRQMVNPQVRTAEQIQAAPFEAVYPQTEGLSSSAISRCIRQLLPHAELLPDPLPPEMLQKYRLLPKAEAVRAIHCPATEEQAAAARRRLIYEELLVLQLGIGRMRSRGAAVTGAPMRRADPSPFWQSLPFAPTGAQRRAVEEILNDMAGETAMNRLLQGDVGSGKTLVAAAAIWACIRAGYQAALLAPTEILAAQHAEGLNRLLAPFGMRVALLTGGMKAAARRTTLAAIRKDEADLVVGTHALMSEGVEFARLGLAVIDEQHRFGVRQRGALAEKAANPHLLVMSATPIPRTLGLLIYGDLDISILDDAAPRAHPGQDPVHHRQTAARPVPLSGQRDRQRAAGVSGLPRHRGCAGRRAERRQDLLRGHCQDAAARPPGGADARQAETQGKSRRHGGFQGRAAGRTGIHHRHRGGRGRAQRQRDGD